MNDDDLIPQLFRAEYRKIVAVLCGRFGFDQIGIAEDIASDTFLAASQSWTPGKSPENPTAWLYTVAANKAKNHLQRNNTFENKVASVIKAGPACFAQNDFDIDLSPQNITDSQLQMMFAVCHPSISPQAQIGLSLRILCGFGIEEIADAFLTSKETINKRLFRGKEKLRQEKIKIELPGPHEIEERLTSVLTTIYLLFNEGYYSVSQHTNKPRVNALLSLMCFHASRFEARFNKDGELILYGEQDANLWNTELISKGAYFLSCAASGDNVSKYHLEAGIAYWHTQQDDSREKWEHILQLYNQLLQIEYSPIAALNRTFALSKANGKREAIVEAEKLGLAGNHFYFVLLGELYTGIDNLKAKQHFLQALSLARTLIDKQTIQKKILRLFEIILQLHFQCQSRKNSC